MQVFLSYSYCDQDFAEKLRNELASREIHTWSPCTDITPGQDWMASIKNALHDSDAVIAVFSPEAVQSHGLNRELAFVISDRMQGHPRAIVPVLAKPVEHLPPFFGDLQWADLSTPAHFQNNLNRLIAAISHQHSPETLAAAVAAKQDYLESEKRLLELEIQTLTNARYQSHLLVANTMIHYLAVLTVTLAILILFIPRLFAIEVFSLTQLVSFSLLTILAALFYLAAVVIPTKWPHLLKIEQANHAK